jgi:protein-L-isoaspartate O-methyltransferase
VSEPSQCVILVPCPAGAPLPECEERLRELERRGHPVWRARGFTSLEVVCGRMASDALARGFGELMWVGPDLVFDPDDVGRLRDHGLPLVGALYPHTDERAFAATFPADTEVRFGPEGGLIELNSCGLGFLLARREVFEAVRRQSDLPACAAGKGSPLVPYFLPMAAEASGARRYLEGDVAFCARAAACGVRVLADTRVRLWRLGQHAYSWEEVGAGIRRTPALTVSLSPQGKPLEVEGSGPPRASLRGPAVPLPPDFPRMNAYLVTYPGNRDSARLTLEDFRACDWGSDPEVIEQPADWPGGYESAARNYKRALERVAADGCDFALVLEDDVRVCRHLRHNLLSLPLVKRDQCDFLGLFVPDLIADPWERQEPHLGYRLARPLYSGPDRLWEKHRLWGAQACLLSRRFVLAALAEWDRYRKGQDTRLISVCSAHGLPMWYTLPCLAEHAPLRSAFGTPAAYAPDFDPDFRLEVGVGFQPPEAIEGGLTVGEGQHLWHTAAGRAVLELGTGRGRATVCLAQASTVLSIEAADQSEAAEWVRRYGLAGRVEFLRSDGPSPGRPTTGQKFDLALVGGAHDADGMDRDLEAALRAVRPGGSLAVHGYPDPSRPNVRRLVDERARRFGWRRVVQTGYLGVFQLP